MQGWIKLHRRLINSQMYRHLNSKQRDVMITCLLMANYSENEWEFSGNLFKANSGQFVTSLENICRNCASDVKVQSVRTALLKLEKWKFLTNKSTKTGRLITICNWAEYQEESNHINNDTNKDLTKSQQRPNKDLTSNKKEEKEKKENKDKEFNFKKSLIELGVEKENAEEWTKARKKEQASNTERAFNTIKSQIDKTGLSANECIEIALGYRHRTGKVWTGLNAEWIKNLNIQNSQINKPVNDGIDRKRYYFRTENGAFRVMTLEEASAHGDKWGIDWYREETCKPEDFR